MAKPEYNDPEYQKARRRLLAGKPMCIHCKIRPATTADHQPPIKLHAHRLGAKCCILVPSCDRCRAEQGGHIATGRPIAPVTTPPILDVELHDPEGQGPKSLVWRRPWLRPLIKVPADATWPRLMTVPSSRATGSYGADFVSWAEERKGRPLRWWQKLFATRALEHDADGRLIWTETLLSMARQLGKSYLTGLLCEWRIEHGHLFGGEQLVLSTGKELASINELARSHMAYARERREAYRTRRVNGEWEIEYRADSSRWLMRSKDSVYGFSAAVVTVDESWAIPQALVDDGVVPTMVAVEQSQLYLLSTPHRLATRLMLDRRHDALEQLNEIDGGDTLLVEWSAARDAELDDRSAWHQASPHWDDQRERTIAKALDRALSGQVQEDDSDEPDPIESFRSQWLAQWPVTRSKPGKGEPLLEPTAWAGCFEQLPFSEGPAFVGLEDNHGRGAAVSIVVPLDDGRYEVAGYALDDWAEAMRWAVKACEAHPGSTVVHGASLIVDRRRFPMGTSMARYGVNQTRLALPLLRQLVTEARVVHELSDLDEQVADARVIKTANTGLGLVAGPRSDLLRATCWALLAAETPRVEPRFE